MFRILISLSLFVVILCTGCTELKVMAGTKELKGIDVSHFQGDVNWNQVKKDGFSFAMAKASEGITSIDPNFDKNWAGIKKAGLVRGSYHFYIAEDDPLDQAATYLKTVKKLGKNDMPPVLDVERGGYAAKYHISVDVYQENVLKWLKKVETVLGKKPVIYTGLKFANKCLNNPVFKTYKLWIAEYDVETPELPAIWKDTGYTFWQKTSAKELHGVTGQVDYDVFKGTEVDFKQLLK